MISIWLKCKFQNSQYKVHFMNKIGLPHQISSSNHSVINAAPSIRENLASRSAAQSSDRESSAAKKPRSGMRPPPTDEYWATEIEKNKSIIALNNSQAKVNEWKAKFLELKCKKMQKEIGEGDGI